jgi:hypothetical protein
MKHPGRADGRALPPRGGCHGIVDGDISTCDSIRASEGTPGCAARRRPDGALAGRHAPSHRGALPRYVQLTEP